MKLKDLAKHLDLSQTTVSRALAGYADVSEATRERVVTAGVAFLQDNMQVRLWDPDQGLLE